MGIAKELEKQGYELDEDLGSREQRGLILEWSKLKEVGR